VILVEGRSRASDVIKLVTQSPWSHAAMYIGKPAEIDQPGLRELVVKHVGRDCEEPLIVESEPMIAPPAREHDLAGMIFVEVCARSVHAE
jgi:hypothetical protein